MKQETVEKIAGAILYEGYILYPYRPSSIKNRQRQYPNSAQAVRCASAPYQIPESAGARNREPMGEE